MDAPKADARYDVVVVGAGNAGLCAALAAREAGARVLVLEWAPEHERGGDTAFTGGLFRFPFTGMDEIAPLVPEYGESELAAVDVGRYTQNDFAQDLDRMSEGLADPVMVDLLVRGAHATMLWLRQRCGVRWMLATGRQAYKIADGRHRFFGALILEAHGGGQGLSDQLFARAKAAGVDVLYRTRGERLVTDDLGRVIGVQARSDEGRRTYACGAVVLASGGFQANAEMRARYLGQEWDLAKVRGTRYDTGDGITMALAAGAKPHGHWSSCHAVAWDLLAPETGDREVGDLFQKHSYPIGIVVNREGRRFIDEGADFRNYTYAKYGREILRQPGRQAFQIFDKKTIPLLRDEYRMKGVTKARADTIEALAAEMLVDPAALRKTVDEYNAAVQAGPFEPTKLDGKAAYPAGQPPKTNWALRIDEPPFEAYAVTCGITFTFGGVKIDTEARVLDTEDQPIPGLYAAGEMVGGLFYYNYPGGSGLMAGAVFGRAAGVSAAKAATRAEAATAGD
ncbi:MAG TPA: FAD-dependent tricarballylate dehydrogenase TcuA [Candidatus Limnocylindria bacterium]|nr:FAD-dependent tricarballylate dehydrogenase TcuA [Candidatus Limnocylindria bacterium]